jgi:hypothetical protein
MDDLLSAPTELVNQIGPWEGARPAAPQGDHARLSFLTPSGLHFGEAPLTVLSNDPLGAAVLQRATRLMQALIAKQQRASA